MRFDEPLRQQEFRFGGEAVYDELAAGGECAEAGQHRFVRGVVDDDFFVRGDLLPEFFDEFAPGRAAVEAGCDEDRDVDAGGAPPQPFEQLRHENPARDRPGVVARDDYGRTPACGELLEERGADGPVQRFADGRRLVRRGGGQRGFEAAEKIPLVDFRLKDGPVVRNAYASHNPAVNRWFRGRLQDNTTRRPENQPPESKNAG